MILAPPPPLAAVLILILTNHPLAATWNPSTSAFSLPILAANTLLQALCNTVAASINRFRVWTIVAQACANCISLTRCEAMALERLRRKAR